MFDGEVDADRSFGPTDLSDERWAPVTPYLALLREHSARRDHDLREVFNGLHTIARTGAPWHFMPYDLPRRAAVYQRRSAGRRPRGVGRR